MSYSNKTLIAILAVIAVALWIFVGFTLLTDDTNNDDSNTNVSNSVLAIVNGEDISSKEIEEAVESYARQGQQVSEKQALELVINQTILFQEAEKEGYGLTDVEAEMELIKQLSERNSTLDDYKADLEEQNISYEEQLQDFKEHIAIEKYVDHALVGENLSVTDEEARDFYNFLMQQSGYENVTFEEMEAYIYDYMAEKKRDDAVNSLISDLRTKAEIVYIE